MKIARLLLTILAVINVAGSLHAVPAGATRREVLIVVNQQSAVSKRIGEYYRLKRGIPKSNVCMINCSTSESINAAIYLQQIEAPIKDYLVSNQLQDQIKFIVLTKGIPLRMWDPERTSSVDSCLTLLFNSSTFGRAPVGRTGVPLYGAVANPFFGANEPFTTFRPRLNANITADAFPQMRDLALLPNGTVVAVGNEGVILRGSGSTWTVVNDVNKAYVLSNFTAVCFTNALEGWASTDDGKVYRTTDGGHNWSKSRGSSNERMSDVAFATASEGWAVGEVKVSSTVTKPQISHYLGSWSVESTGLTSGALYSVSAPDNNNVWACGAYGVILRRSGGVWTAQTNGVPNTTYRSIVMLNVGGNYYGWAIGDGGIIIRTTNGGNNWTQQFSGVNCRLSQVFALDENNLWVTTNRQDARLLRTTNGGVNWNILQSDYNGKFSIVFSGANDGYAAGADGASGKYSVLQTSDGGNNWTYGFKGDDTLWRMKYLVCRLDAYTEDSDRDGLPDDVKALIDRGVTPDPTGSFVLDVAPGRDTGGYRLGNDQIRETHTILESAGVPTIFDEELGAADNFMTGEWLQQRYGYNPAVAGYCSWGSNDHDSRKNTQWARPQLNWNPGAIAICYVSTDGRTLNSADYYSASCSMWQDGTCGSTIVRVNSVYPGWKCELYDAASGSTYFAIASGGLAQISYSGQITSGYLRVLATDEQNPGYFIPLTGARIDASPSQPISGGKSYGLYTPQSLVAELVKEGCSGVIGNVSEPYLDGAGCPREVFPKYVEGYTWAESAYMGMRYLIWQEIAVGDPLMAPYAPLVRITSPNKGAAVTGTMVVTATATDPKGVDRVELLFDGISKGTLTSPPYQWTIDTTQGTDGKHEIEVAAYRDETNVSFRGYDYTEVIASNFTSVVSAPGLAVSLPNDTTVTLANGITNVESGIWGTTVYLEDALRSSAIRVSLPSGISVTEGCAIAVTGNMTTSDGERLINAGTVAIGDWVGSPAPLGISNLWLGGAHPSSNVPSIPGGKGLYNVGLLVKLVGKVTTVGSTFFYLDDGYGLHDNSGSTGVRVECSSLTKPTTTYAAVTGIAGVETVGGALARILRVRKQEDIVPIPN